MAGSGSIKRAADMQTRPIQDVGVKHGRGDILVPQQFLHRSNVVSVFEQMRREAVSKSVTTGCLSYIRSTDRQFHRVLQLFRKGEDVGFRLRAGQAMVLPPGTHLIPFAVWIFPFQREWQINVTAAAAEILPVEFLDPFEMSA